MTAAHTPPPPYVVANAVCPRCEKPLVYFPATNTLRCAVPACKGPAAHAATFLYRGPGRREGR